MLTIIIVHLSEQVMSADKYLSIFSRQMEAIVDLANKKQSRERPEATKANRDSGVQAPRAIFAAESVHILYR